MKKIATLLLAVALVFSATAPAFAEEAKGNNATRTTDRIFFLIGSPILVPLLMVAKPLVTLPGNVKRDGFNVSRALGRSAINSAGIPFEVGGFVFCDQDLLPPEENNALADNDVAATIVGVGVTVGVTSAAAGTPIKYLQTKQLAPAIGVPVVTSIIQDANK